MTGTCVIPHAYGTRWSQICVASLKAYKNTSEFDILMIDNSPGHPSIKGISETRLGDGVRIVQPKSNDTGHQLALDQAIDIVERPWFIAFESDVRVMRAGWLDWMFSFVKDDYTAIVGWYWKDPANCHDLRHYISPAGSLYRTSILKMLKEECLRNPDLVCCYGRDMSKRINFREQYPHTSGKLIPEKNWGPFCECRGFGNVYPYAKDRDYWVMEPGNWIYNRCVMQWECVHLPGDMAVNDEIPSAANLGLPHKYTYVGPSEAEAYFRHYWAGSVSKDFLKHPIPKYQAVRIPYWMQREYRIWNEVVPEDVRKQTVENGWAMTYEQEYAYAMSMVNG